MSPRHREPIPMPDDDDLELEISRDNREIEPDHGKSSGKHGVGAVVLHHTVTAVLVAVVLATGLWSYYQFRRTSFFVLTDEAERSAFEVYAVDAQKDRIAFALDVYQKLFDEYPSSLETLVDEGLLQESDLFYPTGGRHFSYQRMGQTFELEFVAPVSKRVAEGDIVKDTPDDDGGEAHRKDAVQPPAEPNSPEKKKPDSESK